MKVKALAAAAALLASAGVNAAPITNDLIVSAVNYTDGISTAFSTGLDYSDLASGSAGSQSWNVDLSGLNIDDGDWVVWNAVAVGNGIQGEFLSTMSTKPFNFNNTQGGQMYQGYEGYQQSVDYGEFKTAANGQAYHGDAWRGAFGTTLSMDNQVALGGPYTLWGTDNWNNIPVLYEFSAESGYTISLDASGALELTNNATVVPVPAAVWLFGSALLGLVGVGRRATA